VHGFIIHPQRWLSKTYWFRYYGFDPVMKRSLLTLAFVLTAMTLCIPVQSHDVITTAITWDREISRVIYDRCAACHHDGGAAFSLMTFEAARPWAVAIKEEVLSRRMPPWGAIKGYGDFRNDRALTSEQLELITAWVEGGKPEGDARDLLPMPTISSASDDAVEGGIAVSGDFTLEHALKLDGLIPERAPEKESLRITAELPDGSVEPLLWLYEYKAAFKHPFLLRTPLDLPSGTKIRGLPPEAKVILLPAAQ